MATPEELGVFNERLLCQFLVEQLVHLGLQTFTQLQHKRTHNNNNPDHIPKAGKAPRLTGKIILRYVVYFGLTKKIRKYNKLKLESQLTIMLGALYCTPSIVTLSLLTLEKYCGCH